MSKKKKNTKKNRAKSQQKIGAAPGTLIYHGDDRTDAVKITLFEYDENDFVEKEFTDIENCLLTIKPNRVQWINISGIHDTKLIEKLGTHFNIHSLTLEDIVSSHQRAKFEDYDNYVISILKMLTYENEIMEEQISILLFEGMVISFQENETDTFEFIRNRIRQGKGKIRKFGADYLAYALLDAIVDYYFTVLEKLGDKIEEVEDKLMSNPDKETMNELHYMKREMIQIRKIVWPVRELISNLERCETELIKPTTDVYLRDVHDHIVRVIDTVETNRDVLSGMIDIYLSSVSNKMNEVMKVLTIITTIFVPVTFIAGVYGMNFDNMPELHSVNGYFITLAVMMVAIIGLIFYFRKKKWL